MVDLPALITLFVDIQEAVNRPESTLGPSAWGTDAEASAEIEDILTLLRGGTMPDEQRLRALFVPNGLLYEMEAYSDWPGDLVGFSVRFDKAMAAPSS